MRAKFILTLVLLVAGAAIAAGWMAGQATAARLQAERDALRNRRSELLRLQAEHQRLRDAMLEAMRRASVREAAAARVLPPAPIEPAVIAASTRLVPGEWAASNTWANRGQTTATAAVETLLWAAAGGDVPALTALLELDDVTRSKAADLLGRLPAEARQTFGSPEGLIAIATMKNIPQTEAQVAWFNETDADHAVVGLLLGAAEDDRAGASGGSPARVSKLSYLTLQRAASGSWRLVVPATAVDRIARELGGGRE
jgi:type II secretory pathway pseudopilin PulG